MWNAELLRIEIPHSAICHRSSGFIMPYTLWFDKAGKEAIGLVGDRKSVV